MGKTMAKVRGGIVTNIAWCADDQPETDMFKNIDDFPVGIGDTWKDGKFYRSGESLMSPMEKARSEIAALRAENSALKAAAEAKEVV